MTLHNLESLCPEEMERWGIAHVQSHSLGALNGPLEQPLSLQQLPRKNITRDLLIAQGSEG